MLRDGELVLSGAQFRAERPKSTALSTTLKRSLNADIEQWVANGGCITVVERQVVRTKADMQLNRRARGES